MSIDSRRKRSLETKAAERSAVEKNQQSSNDHARFFGRSARDVPHGGINEYPEKISMVVSTAERTKVSVIEKYGGQISDSQKARYDADVSPEKYDIYSTRYFLDVKLDGVPLEQRRDILGFHEVEKGGIALKDSDNYNILRHVTVHETIHALSYQGTKFEQPEGRFGSVEHLDHDGKMNCTGVREIVFQQIPAEGGDVYRINLRDSNRGINEGLTEMYTLRELSDNGEEPGLGAYTQEVKWATILEEAVGRDTLAKAYFNGEVDYLKHTVNRLGGSSDTWERLSAAIDKYKAMRSSNGEHAKMEAERCESEINCTLRKLCRRSKENVYPYAAQRNSLEG